MTHNGAGALIRFLEDLGVSHAFGLPGSSMVSLFHRLSGSHIRFVPALNESTVIAMADGYSRLAGPSPAFIYMMPGTANSLGNLYNAWRDESPLMIFASQQANRWRTREGTVGESDIVSLVQPYTRYAWEVRHSGQLGRVLGTALRQSVGPPSGPTFVALPEDILTEPAPEFPTPRISRQAVGVTDVAQVVERLVAAKRPLVIVGGQVRRLGAVARLKELADMQILRVALEPFWNDRLGIDPSYRGYVGPMSELSSLAAEADFVLAIGCRMFNQISVRERPWFSESAFVVHVNADPLKVEEVSGASWSAATHPDSFLAALIAGCARHPGAGAMLEARQAELLATLERRRKARNNPYSEPARVLAGALDQAYLVDESVSGNHHIVSALHGGRGDHFVSTTGGSLGWGIGAAVGVALASREPVVSVQGDGAFFFGLQGLWSARELGLPITFVVLDNRGYGSTRYFETQYVAGLQDPQPPKPGYLGSDFGDNGPSIVDVARGFGVPATSLKSAADLAVELDRCLSLRSRGPHLLHLPITPDYELT